MNNDCNIRESVNGFFWHLKEINQEKIKILMQNFQISHTLASLLLIKDIEFPNIEEFLYPKLRNFPNPFSLLDMRQAVQKTIEIIQNKQKIVIFGDYDVDGACSSAILKKFFHKLNVNAEIYIPDRITEGYGPNINAIQKFAQEKFDLCIFVDCGSVAFEPLQMAHDLGIATIIIDHHISNHDLPTTCALINPNRLDEDNNYSNLCAAGVVFFFISALKIGLKEQNYFLKNDDINLAEFLDLVALATTCDIVKLTGINRLLLFYGLRIIAKRQNLGLRTLIDTININEKITTFHLGYQIGPKINAGGRVAKSDLGAKLLSTESYEEAYDISQKLCFYNTERQEIEAQVLDEALQQIINKKILENHKLIMLSGAWHPGVIGIVASRIKDKFNLPTIIVAEQNNEIGKTSCRGIPTIDFGATVLNAKTQGIIIEGGGHKMAAGFSFKLINFQKVYDFFEKHFLANIEAHLANKKRIFDLMVTIPMCNISLWQEINKIGPFGVGNREPLVKIVNARIIQCNILKEKHLSLLIYSTNKSIKAMFFNAYNNKIWSKKENLKNNSIDIIGKINCSHWQGKEYLQIIIEDIIM